MVSEHWANSSGQPETIGIEPAIGRPVNGGFCGAARSAGSSWSHGARRESGGASATSRQRPARTQGTIRTLAGRLKPRLRAFPCNKRKRRGTTTGSSSSRGGRGSQSGDLNASRGPRRRLLHTSLLLVGGLLLAGCGLSSAHDGELGLVNGGGARGWRQIGPTGWRAPAAESGPPLLADKSVPYKTFYVTRACEWKSNLFVPKSNDIHFAQSWPSLDGQAAGQEGSSVVYETYRELGPASRQLAAEPAGQDQSRTLLSTDSKALILALPIVIGPTFAGYEPACSIRLIVPPNMRILAKLSSRRLTFAQQQLNDDRQSFGPTRILWLNVSQNQFIETEHKTIETEGNVLAFRFLLERSANKLVPDTRFQVVLSAFQTLSDNSDLSGAGQQPVGSTNQPFVEPQFICDQQRLISANLACDGFKNCQDGHDEEPATCSALRSGTTRAGASNPTSSTAADSTGKDLTIRNQQFGPAVAAADSVKPNWTSRVWQLARETNSLAGFLLGFLLMLLLLTCCSCCTYLVYLVWRRYWPRRAEQPVAGRRERMADAHEADSLATPSSLDNSKQVPARLQSILKKPGPFPVGELPRRRPGEPPPAVPARGRPAGSGAATPGPDSPGRRGALASSLSGGGQPGQLSPHQFKPTPARRLTRPTRPVPVPVEQVSRQQQPHQQRQPTRSRPSVETTSSSTGTQRVTTYHYSSGSTRLSESYLQRLAEQSRSTTTTTATTTTRPDQLGRGASTPPRGPNPNYRRDASNSPQSSLI